MVKFVRVGNEDQRFAGLISSDQFRIGFPTGERVSNSFNPLFYIYWQIVLITENPSTT